MSKIYTKKEFPEFNRTDHSWVMICDAGAGELAISKKNEEFGDVYGSITLHFKNPPECMIGEPPEKFCNLLNGPCWIDGSYLAASDAVDEMRKLKKLNDEDHTYFFNFLAAFMDKYFCM